LTTHGDSIARGVGVPRELWVTDSHAAAAKVPRHYQHPRDGQRAPALCLCGARADAHSAIAPHRDFEGRCEGYEQDPKWKPEPKPEPRPRFLQVGVVPPKLDQTVIEHEPNHATKRARLLDALRPFSGKRTRNCRSKRIAPIVQVQSDNNRVRIRGLETCASVWSCPCCAALIYARRAGELEQAIEKWQGPAPLMLTLTVRHGPYDTLGKLRRGLMRAWRYFWSNGRGAQERKALLDVRHYVRSVEVMHSDANGWHPHIHAFLFCGPELPREDEPAPTVEPLELVAPTEAPKKPARRKKHSEIHLSEDVQKKLAKAWRRAVVKAFTPTASQMPGRSPVARARIGMQYRPTTTRGLDVRPYNAAGGYLAKAGLEVSAITKEGKRKGSCSPWEIARRAAAGDRAAVALWQGYCGAMYGARQLTWSRGARRRFGLGRDDSDERALHEEEERNQPHVKTLVATWTGRAWDRQRRRPRWFGTVTAAIHSSTPHLALAALPGAELRGPRGIVEAGGQQELGRAGPRGVPPPA
jgi:hypothetical protein